MSADDMYLFLMSNAESDNRIGDFRVRLARPVRLEGGGGRYEVALTDLVYPFTFDNLSDRREDANFCENSVRVLSLDGSTTAEVRVPTHYYGSGQQLVDLVNCGFGRLLREQAATGRAPLPPEMPPILRFNPVTSRCMIDFDEYFAKICFSKNLAYRLGMSRELSGGRVHEAAHPAHVGNELMYVYSDLVDFQMLSNVMAPLLKIVNMRGKYGENTEVSFSRPHYVPLLKNCFDSVSIQLKNDRDEVIDFHSGKVAATLHIRRRRQHY